MKWMPVAVVAGAALVAFGAAGLFGRAPKPPADRPPYLAPGLVWTHARTVGVGGCASAACHGGPATASLAGKLDERTWAGSAMHWMAVDPHTKAYAALQSPLAADIMKRMRSTVGATADARCLACHTNPSLANESADAGERSLRAEGVSCEACHGDAGKWLHHHTTWTPANRAAAYEQQGMVKLYDLGERALACAGCHVGAPADAARGYPVRDMNHDMIAAGHPRLNFDFADYQRRLPPHWFEEDQSPDFESKAWLVGRVTHQEAAILLHEDREKRAKANDPRTPWPEFADGKCVSCHHSLADNFPAHEAVPGALIWQPVWPLGARGNHGDLANSFELPPSDVPEDSSAVFQLQRAKRQILAAPDQKIVDTVDHLIRRVRLNPNNRKVLADRDRASQIYHALAARERSRMNREGRTTYDPSFDRIAKSLTLPRGNLDFSVKPGTIEDLRKLLNQ